MGRRTLVGLLIWGAMATAGLTQSPGLTGNWLTPTGSVVQIHPCGDAICLKVVAIEKGAPGTVDANNPDAAQRGRSLCGLEVGSGFHSADGGKSAEGGQLYDPKNGKTYSGAISLNGSNQLKLRGFVGIRMFGRTEEWTRTSDTVPTCQ